MIDNTRSQDFRRLDESVKEILDKIQVQDSSISALNMKQNQITAQLQADQGNHVDHSGTSRGTIANRSQYFSTRQSKVDFLHFNGDDLNGWLYRCQQFFEVDGTPEEAKVKLAAINLEGRALQWHQNWTKYKQGNTEVTWTLYVQALESRFGEHNNGDPMTELLKLKQTGMVSEYHDLFEFWLGKVDISEGYAVSFFLNGLKPVIQQQVKMFMPKTLA